MDYPTMEEVNAANREELYRWFLLLPFPRLVRVKKSAPYEWVPGEGAREIIKRVYERWEEMGGHDKEILEKVLKGVAREG